MHITKSNKKKSFFKLNRTNFFDLFLNLILLLRILIIFNFSFLFDMLMKKFTFYVFLTTKTFITILTVQIHHNLSNPPLSTHRKN